jgi:hypothetical protein
VHWSLSDASAYWLQRLGYADLVLRAWTGTCASDGKTNAGGNFAAHARTDNSSAITSSHTDCVNPAAARDISIARINIVGRVNDDITIAIFADVRSECCFNIIAADGGNSVAQLNA